MILFHYLVVHTVLRRSHILFCYDLRSAVSKGEILLQNTSSGNGGSHVDTADLQVLSLNSHYVCIKDISSVHVCISNSQRFFLNI